MTASQPRMACVSAAASRMSAWTLTPFSGSPIGSRSKSTSSCSVERRLSSAVAKLPRAPVIMIFIAQVLSSVDLAMRADAGIVQRTVYTCQQSDPRVYGAYEHARKCGREGRLGGAATMQVTFWGTRGTVPVPGADTVRYGGNTTCISVLTAANELIILDAGTGVRNLGKQIAGQSGLLCATLFLSHSHWDHIQGFPLFAPAYDARFSLTVLGCATHSMSLRSILERQQDSPVFPVPLDALHADIDIGDYCMDWFTHGSVKMRTAPLHHPGGSCGFRIEEQGRALVFMTDNELPGPGAEWDRFVAFCGGADLLVHDAQYTDAELD